MIIAAGVAALLLAAVHFLADKLALPFIPRSKWLSAAGGVSVAYIFIHMMPELQEWQELFKEGTSAASLNFLDRHLYLVALIGLVVFYGLERAAKLSSYSEKSDAVDEETHNVDLFWIHIISFAVYNFLIGYLLMHRNENTYYSLGIFVVAMAFHFVVNDYGLMEHYKEYYKQKGRWLVATAVLAGWAVGAFTQLSNTLIGIVFAFIAGGVIMNVLKEELPEERRSTYWAFLLGAGIYTFLLLTI